LAQALRVAVIVAHAQSKAGKRAATKTSLTPCLLVDDHGQLDSLSAVIEDIGYQAITTSDAEEALSLVRSGRCRLVLVDVNIPGMNGYEFLDRALRSDPGTHVIVITGEYTLESALDAIRRGATDFLPKPIDRTRLKKALDELATICDQRKRVRALEERLRKHLEFHGIVGKSPAMLEGFDFSRKVAKQHRGTRRPEGGDWRPLALDEVRKLHIARVLELCLGNRLRAAEILGIGRTSLYRFLKCNEPEMCAREKSGAAAA